MKYSESIKPISYLKTHTSEIIRHVAEGRSPYVITQHGEAKAVVQGVKEYEQNQATLALLKMLAMSSKSLQQGKVRDADEVFTEIHARIRQDENP